MPVDPQALEPPFGKLMRGKKPRATGCKMSVRSRSVEPLLEWRDVTTRLRVLPFDTDAARRYADLAETARNGGRGLPTPDGYIAAIAASRGFLVASRDTSPYEAAGVTVINPWDAA